MSLHGAVYGKEGTVTTLGEFHQRSFQRRENICLGSCKSDEWECPRQLRGTDILRRGNAIFSFPSRWPRETENRMEHNCFVKWERLLTDQLVSLWICKSPLTPALSHHRIWAILLTMTDLRVHAKYPSPFPGWGVTSWGDPSVFRMQIKWNKPYVHLCLIFYKYQEKTQHCAHPTPHSNPFQSKEEIKTSTLRSLWNPIGSTLLASSHPFPQHEQGRNEFRFTRGQVLKAECPPTTSRRAGPRSEAWRQPPTMAVLCGYGGKEEFRW